MQSDTTSAMQYGAV